MSDAFSNEDVANILNKRINTVLSSARREQSCQMKQGPTTKA